MPARRRFAWPLCACLFAAAWGAHDATAFEPQAVTPAPLVVATYAYPHRDRAASIQPLADHLSARSGRAVEVRLFASPTDLVNALRDGKADVAVPNLHGFLQARRWPDRIAVLPVPEVPPEQAARYRSVIVARAGLATIDAVKADAARLHLVLVGRDSASGGFVPAQHLAAQGAPVQHAFASLTYAGSHASALQALVEGRADVAALAADVHDAATPPGLHELWRSPPIPPGPLLCRRNAEVRCSDIADWLLRAHERDPRVMAGLRDGWPEFGDATRLIAADVDALDALAHQID